MISRRDFFRISAAGSALASMGYVPEAKATFQTVLPNEKFCVEKQRKIPLIGDVDIVVVGGSSRAVAAAAAAARNGSKVFLIANLPYLGDDICGSLLYEREKQEILQTSLALKLFPIADYPTPMHVKKTLEDELINNDVQFLYSSFVTNVLLDTNNHLGGVVIANRSGREAIRCKSIIDATHEASVSKMAGVRCTPFKPGVQDFYYTVVGNTPRISEGIINYEKIGTLSVPNKKEHLITRYHFQYDLRDDTYASIELAEQFIRTATWDEDQVDSSDLLWYIPKQTILSKQAYKDIPGSIRDIPFLSLQPSNVERLWVLGPCAELPRELVAKVVRPISALTLGEYLGEYVSEQAKSITVVGDVVVKRYDVQAFNYGKVSELLSPLRPLKQHEFIISPTSSLPVLGTYDVVVMGGGTAGASAGISAARHGAKTLVLEYLHGLGGLSSLGMIGVYWDGFREGFTAQVDKGVYGMAAFDHPRQPKYKGHFPADWKMEWLRKQILDAGGSVWFGVIGCGTLVDDGKVKGVVVATPFGRGVLLSKVIIDSTGSADIAIAAGASFDYTGKKTLAVQGAGTGKWAPGDHYNNNDWLFVDDSDILDVSRAYVQAKYKFADEYDMVKMPQTRERRRVIGDYIVSVYDVINHRRYKDTISYHRSSFDTHGMIVDPFFILNPPHQRHIIYDADVPLRSLLPKGLDGIIVTGLGASAHRDAMPVIRMQACLQNQGYAVGYLSAMSVKENKSVRAVNIKKVQRHLVEIGNLPKRVLTDRDFKGFSRSEFQKAVLTVTDNYKGLEVLLTDKEQCVKLLSKRMQEISVFDEKVILASVLCILGDDKYASVLATYIQNKKEWDDGWHYRGMGQFGMCLSKLDALIASLGRSKNPEYLSVILEKARILYPEDYLSHFRAISNAVREVKSRQAIPVLVDLLTMPGVRNHELSSYKDARSKAVPGENDNTTRNQSLKELYLARALYMCGDKNDLGKQILVKYANGLEGHYARFAYEVLTDKTGKC